jgi:hypothetical protein
MAPSEFPDTRYRPLARTPKAHILALLVLLDGIMQELNHITERWFASVRSKAEPFPVGRPSLMVKRVRETGDRI